MIAQSICSFPILLGGYTTSNAYNQMIYLHKYWELLFTKKKKENRIDRWPDKILEISNPDPQP